MRLAIIGTAGPKSSKPAGSGSVVMTKQLFNNMVERVRAFIGDEQDLAEIDLVSGGSAWAGTMCIQCVCAHYVCGSKFGCFFSFCNS
jgi:hypothetical protein